MKRCRKLAIPTKKTKADVLNGPGVASASAAGGCDFDIPEILLCMILPGRKLFGCLNNIARLKVVLTACWRLQWFSMIFRLFFLGISSSDLFYIYIYIYMEDLMVKHQSKNQGFLKWFRWFQVKLLHLAEFQVLAVTPNAGYVSWLDSWESQRGPPQWDPRKK